MSYRHCYSNYIDHILNKSPSKKSFTFSKQDRFPKKQHHLQKQCKQLIQQTPYGGINTKYLPEYKNRSNSQRNIRNSKSKSKSKRKYKNHGSPFNKDPRITPSYIHQNESRSRSKSDSPRKQSPYKFTNNVFDRLYTSPGKNRYDPTTSKKPHNRSRQSNYDSPRKRSGKNVTFSNTKGNKSHRRSNSRSNNKNKSPYNKQVRSKSKKLLQVEKPQNKYRYTNSSLPFAGLYDRYPLLDAHNNERDLMREFNCDRNLNQHDQPSSYHYDSKFSSPYRNLEEHHKHLEEFQRSYANESRKYLLDNHPSKSYNYHYSPNKRSNRQNLQALETMTPCGHYPTHLQISPQGRAVSSLYKNVSSPSFERYQGHQKKDPRTEIKDIEKLRQDNLGPGKYYLPSQFGSYR